MIAIRADSRLTLQEAAFWQKVKCWLTSSRKERGIVERDETSLDSISSSSSSTIEWSVVDSRVIAASGWLLMMCFSCNKFYFEKKI